LCRVPIHRDLSFIFLIHKHRNDRCARSMPTEACYVISIENAILLSTTYGILSVYFEDVMSHGFLFFAVFIGLCLCYVFIVLGFGLVLFDDDTSKQIILLESNAVDARVSMPTQVASFARLLARSGALCGVALFIAFVTVGVEFLTDENAPEADSLPTIALKKIETETQLTTQFSVSTAFAVFFMIVLMLLANNQQLNSILVRLQNASDAISPAEKSVTSTGDDVTLFVRTLLILYLIVCDSSGTFVTLPSKAMPSFLLDLIPDFKGSVFSLRNNISLLFIAWCLFVDIARAFVPNFAVLLILVELLVTPQIFGAVLTFEILFEDSTLTNFACMVLVACDAFCVVCASAVRIYHIMKDRTWHAKKGVSATNGIDAPTGKGLFLDSSAFQYSSTSNAGELNFNETDINLNNINLRFFEKKSN